jgi:hypothetical protein
MLFYNAVGEQGKKDHATMPYVGRAKIEHGNIFAGMRLRLAYPA